MLSTRASKSSRVRSERGGESTFVAARGGFVLRAAAVVETKTVTHRTNRTLFPTYKKTTRRRLRPPTRPRPNTSSHCLMIMAAKKAMAAKAAKAIAAAIRSRRQQQQQQRLRQGRPQPLQRRRPRRGTSS
jgi:hypothetical protein